MFSYTLCLSYNTNLACIHVNTNQADVNADVGFGSGLPEDVLSLQYDSPNHNALFLYRQQFHVMSVDFCHMFLTAL